MSEKKGKAIGLLIGMKVGDEAYVSAQDGKHFTLRELQTFVGGKIEILRTKEEGKVLVVNEEGKLENLPVNQKATDLYLYGSLEPSAWERGLGDVVNGYALLLDEKYLN